MRSLSFSRRTSTRVSRLPCGIFFAAALAVIAGAVFPAFVRAEEPKMLDIERFYQEKAAKTDNIFHAIAGRQIFDGVPFNVAGYGALCGKKVTSPNPDGTPRRKAIMDIRVERKFDDLNLLHFTFWSDAEREIVAYICMNYEDGTKYITPIRYGVHVRDWYRLFTEEKETVTDETSKVVWRRPPVEYDAPIRLFKSTLKNPFPDKVVQSLDILSAQHLAAYNIMAMTVTDVLPIASENEGPDRHFRGKAVVTVLDARTGEPVEGALVDGYWNGLASPPFYTDAQGEGTIRYPTDRSLTVNLSVVKKGYQSGSISWGGNISAKQTVRLQPTN